MRQRIINASGRTKHFWTNPILLYQSRKVTFWTFDKINIKQNSNWILDVSFFYNIKLVKLPLKKTPRQLFFGKNVIGSVITRQRHFFNVNWYQKPISPKTHKSKCLSKVSAQHSIDYQPYGNVFSYKIVGGKFWIISTFRSKCNSGSIIDYDYILLVDF